MLIGANQPALAPSPFACSKGLTRPDRNTRGRIYCTLGPGVLHSTSFPSPLLQDLLATLVLSLTHWHLPAVCSMKRIIIAFDGTGQSASRGDWSISTNVNRLCHALLNSRDLRVQQLVFYVSGVGTQDLGLGGFGTVVQGALGDGVEENVADGYTFIINNYLPGDELFVFGFSRGAFTARVLANIVARLGVFSKAYSWQFKDALAKYKLGKEVFEEFLRKLEKDMALDRKRWSKEKGVYVPRIYEAKVKVVGCWDTVASLGIPWRPASNAGGVSGEYKHFDGGLVKGESIQSFSHRTENSPGTA